MKEQLIDSKLRKRMKELDQFPRNDVNPKLSPLIVAKIFKDGVTYYPFAIDEKRNEVCCYMSNVRNVDKPRWINIKELERKPLLGKRAVRDTSFAEIYHFQLDLEPHRNSIENYFIEKKNDSEEQSRIDNMKENVDKHKLALEQDKINKQTQQKELDAIRNNERYAWER